MTFCLYPRDGSGYATGSISCYVMSKFFSVRQFWQFYQYCVKYLHLTIVEREYVKI